MSQWPPMRGRVRGRVSAAAFLIVLAAAGFGCRTQGRRVVGLVPKGANHIFWKTVHAGGIKAAQEFGFDLEWNAPTLEIDSSRQIEIVESMINRRLAGIALAPVDKRALVGVVERAAREGIPVSIFDSGIDTGRRVSYVATNPRWSPQNRPLMVTPKPANGGALRTQDFIPRL